VLHAQPFPSSLLEHSNYAWRRVQVVKFLIEVGIATGYGLDDRGVRVRVPVGARIFSSPRRPDRLWGPSSLLSNGHQGQSDRGVKLTTHLQLAPRSKKVDLYIHSSIRLHGAVLNQLSPRNNFTFYQCLRILVVTFRGWNFLSLLYAHEYVATDSKRFANVCNPEDNCRYCRNDRQLLIFPKADATHQSVQTSPFNCLLYILFLLIFGDR
jgi:hypothetical protein